MANIKKSVVENIPGAFFVDTTCIDCDTCRQLAPAVFGEAADHAYVHRQPVTNDERRSALHALVSCPTGSIGCRENRRGLSQFCEVLEEKWDCPPLPGGSRIGPRAVMGDFPLVIEAPVYYCGFNSPKSFGGNSYFVRHPAGNWLIDSPKFLPQLARRLEALGGIAHIFLTHRDDVADAARYARHFGSQRFIHRLELRSQPDAEVVFDGREPLELAPGFLAIPTPGHTAGHCVLLVDQRFLFTGDHLDWDRHRGRLSASRDYCWHSWPQQIESIERLLERRFEWVLPGHGQRVQLPADEMRRQLTQLVRAMGDTP